MARNKLAVITLLMAFCLGATLVANADPVATLKIFDNYGNTVTITDGGLGDVNSAAGAITFVGAIGDWNINVDTGLTIPATAANQLQDLNFVDTKTTTNHQSTLTILFGAINYDNPLGIFNITNHIGGTQTGLDNVAYNVYFDASNNLFAGGLVASSGAMSVSPFGYANSIFGLNNSGGMYSLYQEVILTSNLGTANASGDGQLLIPEPASMSILGAGLLGLAGLFRRKLVK